MSTESRIAELVKRWQELQQRGETVTADDLCTECPELVETLRKHLQALQGGKPPPSILRPTLDTKNTIPSTPPPTVEQPLPVVEPQAGVEPVPGFRLTRLLGMGGFGSVWLADAPGQFPVAMKFVMLSGHIGASELRSLEVLRHLRHPNLLTTFGAWRNDKYLIVAMEVADRTLSDRCKEAKGQGLVGIPAPELHEYMVAAANAIDYLNQPHHFVEGQSPVRVQHRDIKPANILLVGKGVKVADFGLARVLEHTVVSHTGGLTPIYAAPEFFQGKTSRHSDQYSLAVAYCELRGGRVPFTGAFADLIVGHVEKQPDLSMLPANERPVVARALAKDPDKRWPSCTEFVEALGQSDGDASPRSIRPSRKAEGTPRRRAWLTGSAMVLAVALALIGWNWSAIRALLTPAPQPQPDVVTPVDPKDPSIAKAKNGENIEGKKNVSIEVKPIEKKKAGIDEPKKPVDTVGERLRFVQHAPAEVRSVAWAPNSSRVISGDAAGKLWLWETADGKEVKQLPGHTKAVQCVAISADGRFALTGGDDMTARLIDLEARAEPKVLRIKPKNDEDKDFEFYGGGFLESGRALSAGNSNQIIFWDLEAGKEANRMETSLEEVLCLALSRDGRRALIGGAKGALLMRDVRPDEKELNPKTKEERYEGHLDNVLTVAFFPDGQRFVSGGGGDGAEKGNRDYVVRVWQMGDKQPRATFTGHKAPVGCVAVSPDGARVLSGDLQGGLLLWEAATSLPFPRFDQPKESDGKRLPAVNCLLFNRDGTEAVSGHTDGTLRVWTLPKSRE